MRAAKGSLRTDGSYTRYFGCTGKSHNRICEGVKVPVYAESLENMTYDLIMQKLMTLKDVRRNVQNDNSGRRNLLMNRLSEIRSLQDRLVERMLDKALEPDILHLLNERAKKLSEEQREVKEKLEVLEEEESEIMSVICLSEHWQTASYEEKKAVAALLIERIYIEEDGTTEVVWNI